MYSNESKIKIENKNTTKEYEYFLESHFIQVNRSTDVKGIKPEGIIYQMVPWKITTSPSKEKTSMNDQFTRT